MDRDRIVHAGVNPGGLELVAGGVPLPQPDGEHVVHMAAFGPLRRRADAGVGKQTAIAGRVRAALFRPALEIPQLHPQNRPLDAIHAVVVGLDRMLVAALFPPVPEQPYLPGERRIVGGQGAALAVGAEILAWVEAEAGHLADRTASTPL